jgi:hypothetical protein
MIEQVIRNAIDDLVDVKVFLNTALEKTSAPYIVVYRLSGPRGYTHDGRDGTVVSRFQVSVFETDYRTAKLLASEVYELGDYTDETVSLTQLINEVDLYDDVTKLHHIVLDFEIYHNE